MQSSGTIRLRRQLNICGFLPGFFVLYRYRSNGDGISLPPAPLSLFSVKRLFVQSNNGGGGGGGSCTVFKCTM